MWASGLTAPVRHFKYSVMADVLREILRVLRPGGCAWLGWLGTDGSSVPQSSWDNVSVPGVVLATINEKEALGMVEYNIGDAYALISCKVERAGAGKVEPS